MTKPAVFSILAISVLSVLPALAADSGTLNDAERAFLIEQNGNVEESVSGQHFRLSEAQWTFKPAPNVWSVQECAEHIVLSETFLFDTSQSMLKTPAVPRPEKSNAEFDQKLAIGVQDRSHKATAPAPIDPAGRTAGLTPASAAKAFTAKRNQNEQYVKTTTDDLRTHVAAGPAGPMDAYQFLVLMATHTARHTEQIKEVQANPNYPAK